MAMAAGKSAGKPPRMTDKALRPPAEAAMAMTGNESVAHDAGVVLRAAFFERLFGFGFGFVFMKISATSAEKGRVAPPAKPPRWANCFVISNGC